MRIQKIRLSIIAIIALLFFACEAFAAPAKGIDFFWLCRTGTIKEIKAAIENGGDVKAQKVNGESVLYSAMYNKNPDVFSLLIEKGADVNARDKGGGTVLMAVAYLMPDPIPVMRTLIEKGADVNLQLNDGRTALMFAVAAFQNREPEKAISFLLDSGANPNLKYKTGKREETALDAAKQVRSYKDTEILKRLEDVTSVKPD